MQSYLNERQINSTLLKQQQNNGFYVFRCQLFRTFFYRFSNMETLTFILALWPANCWPNKDWFFYPHNIHFLCETPTETLVHSAVNKFSSQRAEVCVVVFQQEEPERIGSEWLFQAHGADFR